VSIKRIINHSVRYLSHMATEVSLRLSAVIIYLLGSTQDFQFKTRIGTISLYGVTQINDLKSKTNTELLPMVCQCLYQSFDTGVGKVEHLPGETLIKGPKIQ